MWHEFNDNEWRILECQYEIQTFPMRSTSKSLCKLCMEEWNAQKIASTVSDLKRAVPGFVANVSLAQA